MKPITRIRIILFALMIFGSFANFALNEWGITLIIWCEILMAASFLWEVVVSSIVSLRNPLKRKLNLVLLGVFGLLCIIFLFTLTNIATPQTSEEKLGFFIAFTLLTLLVLIIINALYDFFKKIENQGNYESFFLFILFLALVFKNNSWPGTDIMFIFSILFLVPYFITTTFKFFKENYKSGKALVIVLTIGSIATVLLGLTFLMKTMHWPFADTFFYIATIVTLIMIGGALKWKYIFNGTKINILQGLRLFKTNIILLFFMLFVFMSYKHFAILKLAPDFYSADYPESYYNYRNINKWDKAIEIRDAYGNFVQKAEENGFIK
jgi:hypothetical protein